MSYYEKLSELYYKLEKLSNKITGGYTCEKNSIEKQPGYDNYILASNFPNEYIKDKALESLQECQRKM